LGDYLLENSSALLNWAFFAPKETFRSQVRKGKYAFKAYLEDPLADYVTSNFIDDRKGFLSSLRLILIEGLEEHLHENGLPPLRRVAIQKTRTNLNIRFAKENFSTQR
jgi:hypothetical protein